MNKIFTPLSRNFWAILKRYLLIFENFIFAEYIKVKLSHFIQTDYIRNSTSKQLLDEQYLNKLISKIGLSYNPNFYYNFSFLQKYFSTGILMLQYPHQFTKYLLTLSKYDIRSYLELGTGFGGSFITTVEYLRKLNPNFTLGVGIDRTFYVNIQMYAKFENRVKYLVMDSQSAAFREFISQGPTYDLIFIDSNHSYEYCKRDFEMIKEKAKMIAFHDILEKDVDKVWRMIKESYRDECIFHEFTDQYLRNSKFLGIGLLIRK